MSKAVAKSDVKLLLVIGGIMVVLILLIAILKPRSATYNPRPTTTNSGPQGARAAYLMLQAMGRTTSIWGKPLKDLNAAMNDAQAQRTTLVLAEPAFDPTEIKVLKAELKRFLERGGRVLATGPMGAMLLPDAQIKQAIVMSNEPCKTTPEGPGPLAQVGSVETDESVKWDNTDAHVEVAQRCGSDPVVVRYGVGAGDVIWWTSAAPLENQELKNAADLGLLLASIGEGRDVVFDESLHGATRTLWDTTKGLPLFWLKVQAVLLFGLLIFSFSRRSGPLRMPVQLPRSSPVEFATSMGDLYEKGGATSAATDAARRRLLRVLTREAGISQQTVQQGPEAIAEALQVRHGGDWSRLSEHLVRCQDVHHSKIPRHGALVLVQALCGDVDAVRARLKPPATKDSVSEESVAIS